MAGLKLLVDAAKTMCVPADNKHGDLGQWAFVEVLDPWDCDDQIRETGRA